MALKWLNSIESPSGRIARWTLELQQYDFEIAYRNIPHRAGSEDVASWKMCVPRRYEKQC